MKTNSSSDLVPDAKGQIESDSPEKVKKEVSDSDVKLIDLREREELEEKGTLDSSVHAPRGLLEFYADPESSFLQTGIPKGQ